MTDEADNPAAAEPESSSRPLTDIRAERAVLGCLLGCYGVFPKVAGKLVPSFFADHDNAVVYGAIVELVAKGVEPDDHKMKAILETAGALPGVDLGEYMLGLMVDGVGPDAVGVYADAVAAAFWRRQETDARINALAAASPAIWGIIDMIADLQGISRKDASIVLICNVVMGDGREGLEERLAAFEVAASNIRRLASSLMGGPPECPVSAESAP